MWEDMGALDSCSSW